MTMSTILDCYAATAEQETAFRFDGYDLADDAERACDDDTYASLLDLLGLSDQWED